MKPGRSMARRVGASLSSPVRTIRCLACGGHSLVASWWRTGRCPCCGKNAGFVEV